MILLSHPTANEFVRQTLEAFDRAGMLREFWTAISWDRHTSINRFLPKSVEELFARRSFSESIRSRTRTVPFREAVRLLAGVAGIASQHETGVFSVDAVFRELDRKVATKIRKIDNCRAVYAYEDGALESFRVAHDRGLKRIYDLPIGYWRVGQRIFAEEKEFEPEWAPTLTGTLDSAEKLVRKDDELRLANRVVVASSFSKQTLAEAPCTGKIDIIPYGAPSSIADEITKPSDRLKVLFAGSLGQRKGLSYLLRAIGLLKRSVELTLLGRKAASDCAPLEDAIRKHRWIPTLSHEATLREMQQHDVLVLPSLFEGFGLVILEAMAQGVPVITTDRTAGPDVIQNEVDGFIVPIRSAEAIAEKLDFLARNHERLLEIKSAAKRKAASLGWESYRQRLVEVAREVIAR